MNAHKSSFKKTIFLIAALAAFCTIPLTQAHLSKKSWVPYSVGAGGTLFSFLCVGVAKQCMEDVLRGNGDAVPKFLAGVAALAVAPYLFHVSYKDAARREGCLDMIMMAGFAGFIASLSGGISDVCDGDIWGLVTLGAGTASGIVGTYLAYQKRLKKR